MMNNGNHIDNWLQQSAAMGNTPFENADWLAMKELLEKKRKRRLLIIWWVAGILLLGIILAGMKFYFNPNTKAVQQKQTANISKPKELYDTIKVINQPKQEIIIEKNIDTIQPAKGADINSQSNNHQYAIINGRHSNKRIVRSATPEKNIAIDTAENIAKNNSQKNDMPPVQQKINALQHTQRNIAAIKNTGTPGFNQPVIDNNSRTYTPVIKYMHSRYMDSVSTKRVTDDSIAINDTAKKISQEKEVATTKKESKPFPKNYIDVHIGFAQMNIATPLQTGFLQLQYHHAVVKNLYVGVGAKGFLYHNDALQKHSSIYKISPVAGTTLTAVNYRETGYAINKGYAVEPGIDLHYKINKLSIGIAASYGFVINPANTTASYIDSFKFYSPLPAGVKLGGGNYQNNNFIGKSYSNFLVQCSYEVYKKWSLCASYAYLINYNRIEGVVDDNKKRNSFYFSIGYRF